MKIIRVVHEEPFRLDVFHVVGERGTDAIAVPLVNDWLQLSLEVRRVPTRDEQRTFFLALRELRRDLEGRSLCRTWFFLHKPPGLRLRFRSDGPAEPLIEALLAALAEWEAPWLGARAFDSYFEQRGLLAEAFEADVNRLLTAAADEYMDALLAGAHCGTKPWAEFSVAFLDRHLNDRWLAWEALGRLARLRSARVDVAEAMEDRRAGDLCDPAAFGTRLPLLAAGRSDGFEASTALLQCLNYVYNMWALDLPTQQQVIGEALEACRPELARP